MGLGGAGRRTGREDRMDAAERTEKQVLVGDDVAVLIFDPGAWGQCVFKGPTS